MAFDSTAFMTDLLKDVQIDDASKAALQATLGNPVIAKRLEDSTLRQKDYSKLMTEYQDKVEKAQEYWNGLVKWDKEAHQKLEQEKQSLKQQLVDAGVNLNDGTDPLTQRSNGVTQEELQRLAQEAIDYNNAIVTIGLKHYKEFGEILDTSELLKVAARDKVNVQIAHERMIQPKREEVQQADIQVQLKKAREEGYLEGQKNSTIPIADQPLNNNGVPHSLDQFDLKDKAPEYGAMAAVKAFRANMGKGGVASL